MSSKSKQLMSELKEKQQIDKLFELMEDPIFFVGMPNYQEKKEEIVKILNSRIRQGKSLDIIKDGESLLSSAILNMHPQIALLMVNKGANVDTRSKDGEPVIILANESLMYNLTTALIEKNAKLDVKNPYDGYTLLHKPVHYHQHEEEEPTNYNKYDILRKLCLKLFNTPAINARDNNNKTPIMTIIDEYSNEVAFEACQILIENGEADINLNDGINKKGKSKGNTALHFAIMKKNTELSKYLIEKGANIEHYNNDDMTPLHLAVVYNLPEIVKEIIKINPKTVLAKNNKNKTPKDLVIKTGDNKTLDEIKSTFNEIEDKTRELIYDGIHGPYKKVKKSSNSPERTFKSAKDNVLGDPSLAKYITGFSKFGGKKKTYKKKCFICKKYKKKTLKNKK